MLMGAFQCDCNLFQAMGRDCLHLFTGGVRGVLPIRDAAPRRVAVLALKCVCDTAALCRASLAQPVTVA
jgi:hypothetical protein